MKEFEEYGIKRFRLSISEQKALKKDNNYEIIDCQRYADKGFPDNLLRRMTVYLFSDGRLLEYDPIPFATLYLSESDFIAYISQTYSKKYELTASIDLLGSDLGHFFTMSEQIAEDLSKELNIGSALLGTKSIIELQKKINDFAKGKNSKIRDEYIYGKEGYFKQIFAFVGCSYLSKNKDWEWRCDDRIWGPYFYNTANSARYPIFYDFDKIIYDVFVEDKKLLNFKKYLPFLFT